jgi:hypothetical protein
MDTLDALTVLGLVGVFAAATAWRWYRSPHRVRSEEVPSDLSIRAYVANTNRRFPQD